MGFDLSQFDTPSAAEAGIEIELIHKQQPTGWFVTVRGDHAPSVRKWQLSIGNKFRMKEWQEKRASKDDGPVPLTPEDLEIGLRSAAARLSGFRGIMFNGKPFEFNEANAYELVRRYPPWADQIIQASGDISNFSPKASSN